MNDDTDLVQGYFDRGEELPPGEYVITRPIRWGAATINPEGGVMRMVKADEWDLPLRP